MKYKRALLVQGKYGTNLFSNVLPLGLGYISEFLTHHNIANDVFDLNIYPDAGELASKIRHFNPDIIGISLIETIDRQSIMCSSATKGIASQARTKIGSCTRIGQKKVAIQPNQNAQSVSVAMGSMGP